MVREAVASDIESFATPHGLRRLAAYGPGDAGDDAAHVFGGDSDAGDEAVECDAAAGAAPGVAELGAVDVFEGLVADFDAVAFPVGAVPRVGVPGVLLDGTRDFRARRDGDLPGQVFDLAWVDRFAGGGVDRLIAARVTASRRSAACSQVKWSRSTWL